MPNARIVTSLPRGAESSPIEADGTQWIEIMPTVERDRNGPWYWTITPEDLATWAADMASRPDDIAVDYDHAEGSTGTKAAGWFTGETEIRDGDDGSQRLWAKVRWTSVAAEEIRDGQWRRISPEMTFANKDPKTGLLTKAKQIVAATLTNRPHFKQLAPVASEVVWQPGEGLQDLSARIFDALNPGGWDKAAYWVMDVAEGKALVGEYDGQATWVVPFTVSDAGEVDPAPRSEWTAAEQEWVEVASAALKTNRAQRPFTEGALMHESIKAIASELGLADDATDEQVLEAVKAAKAKGETEPTPEGAVVLSSEQVAELQQNAQAGLAASKELKETRVRGMLEQAVRDGKILPAQAARADDGTPSSLESWGMQDEAALAAHLESTPANTYSLTPRGSGEGGPEGGEDEQEVKAVEKTVGRASESEKEREVVGADVVVKANEILAAKGKTEPTEAEFAEALAQASEQVAAAA